MTTDEIREVVACLTYKDWQFCVGQKGETLYLQIRVGGLGDRMR